MAVTVRQFEALTALLKSKGAWDNLHGKTQNVLLRAGYVDANKNVTDAGKAAMASYVPAPVKTDSKPAEVKVEAVSTESNAAPVDERPEGDYIVLLHRPRENWRDSSVTCGDFRVEYRMQNGLAKLAHDMREAGMPDGSVRVNEIRCNNSPYALKQYMSSLYAIADTLNLEEYNAISEKYPTMAALSKKPAEPVEAGPMSVKQHEALVLLTNNKNADIHGRIANVLIRNGYVTADMVVTDAGKAAIEAYNNKAVDVSLEPPEKLTIVWFQILQNLDNRRAWVDLHGKTKNSLQKRGVVRMDGDQPVLTDIGRRLMAQYVNDNRS